MNHKLKIHDIQRAVQAIDKIDKLEELLYNQKMYRDIDGIKVTQKLLVVSYKFALDELRSIVNRF